MGSNPIQTSMSNTPKPSRFVWGTSRFDSIRMESRFAQIDFRLVDSTIGERFVSIRSNRVESTTFSTHPAQSIGSQDPWNNDTYTFLVLKTWPQTSVDSFELSRIGNNFNPPYIVQGCYILNRLPACRIDNRGNDSCGFDRIESNRQHFQPTLKAQISYIF